MNWKWWDSDRDRRVDKRLNDLEVQVASLTRKIYVQKEALMTVKQELVDMEGQVAALSGVVSNVRGDVVFLKDEIVRLEGIIAGGETVTSEDLQPLKDRISALGLQLAEVDDQTPEQPKPTE